MPNQFAQNVEILRTISSDVAASTRDGDYEIHLIIKHNAELNSFIKMKTKYNLFSIIKLSIENIEIYNTDLLPVTVRIDFAWKELDEERYPFSFPTYVSYRRAPLNFEIENRLYWNKRTNKFFKTSREIKLLDYITGLLRKHMLATKRFRGIFVRFGRLLKYDLISPIITFIKKICIVLFFISSGKKVRYKESEYGFNSYYQRDSTVDSEISESSKIEIEFFGMTMNVVPVITYSMAHLAAYFIVYYINFKPKIIVNIFINPFLSLVYAVTTFSLLYFVISRTVLRVGEFLVWLNAKVNKKKLPSLKTYDNN